MIFGSDHAAATVRSVTAEPQIIPSMKLTDIPRSTASNEKYANAARRTAPHAARHLLFSFGWASLSD